MHIEEHRWYSPSLGQEMALKIYGHYGPPLLVFPCSRGRYFDYEGMGMIGAIDHFIDGGQIKLFCVDSVDSQSWYNFDLSPADRNGRHEAYDRYIVSEVVPFIRDHCRTPEIRPITNGCSMGAYHAVNFFFKHPGLFAGTIACSGLYRLDRREFNLSAADIPAVYYNSPLSYLAGLTEPWLLENYRQGRIMISVGQGAWDEEALEDTRALQAICQAKGIPAWIDIWGHDVNHDWPWWFKQMNHFLAHL
ncbi:MAG: alpha/beta hydrolase-fold protein [Desulforhopalus sp.]|nr:alpha/beta hydrolase-fold protein [Desulforhopalus sp.]